MISQKGLIINNDWLYRFEGEEVRVDLPHTTKVVEYNYFDEKGYQAISEYEKALQVTEGAKRVFLKFEGVMTAFELFVNNQQVAIHAGGYIPHTIEITDFVMKGSTNKVIVKVDSTERADIPPFGHVIDYLTFGGIYRDVIYYELEECFIENIFYKYTIEDIQGNKARVILHPEVVINRVAHTGVWNIEISLMNKSFKQTIQLEEGKTHYNLEPIEFEDVTLWGLEYPHLYVADATLSKEGKVYDTNQVKIGFRDLHIDATGVYLNSKKIKIFGLNRHQSFPYVGYAMPKRVQEKDADILKFELKLNTVRTSHYPQSPYFLNRCDEIGLLVLEEIPGWQFISGDEGWRQQVLHDVKGMIERDYNHPSIITWGVRINESWDDEALYTQTNDLARVLDDTRMTSGVRCYEKSQLLEDIYTMNDFVHNGGEESLRAQQQVTGLDYKVPYLITEFCGHIYPTKRFDNEERLVEHALRHGRVHSRARQGDDYLGAVGWCAFDYNTHYDFGSGDRICYHGVMDMYRMPKFAAYLYKSQTPTHEEVVIEPLTYWSRGEKREAIVFPIYVCTNCDAIEVVIGGVSRGVFERNEDTIEAHLKELPYPPICITTPSGDWGSKWSDVEFIGLKNGKAIGKKKFCSNPMTYDLYVKADDMVLQGGMFDATRITVEAIDQGGNLLPYIQGALQVEVQGAIEVIGNKLLPIVGGTIAFWVKTSSLMDGKEGKVCITSSLGITKELLIKIQ